MLPFPLNPFGKEFGPLGSAVFITNNSLFFTNNGLTGKTVSGRTIPGSGDVLTIMAKGFTYREDIATISALTSTGNYNFANSVNDCKTWNLVSNSTTLYNTVIRYNNNGQYLATRYGVLTQNTNLRSSDGINWTSFTVSGVYMDISYANGRWFLGGVRSTAFGALGRVATSTDGVSWATTDMAMGSVREVAYGNGVYVMIGGPTSGGTTTLRSTSANGTTWGTPASFSGVYATNIVFGNGVFVAAGVSDATSTSASVKTMTSTNGTTWGNTQTLPKSSTGTWVERLIFDGTNFYLLMQNYNSSNVIVNRKAYVSANGASWTECPVSNVVGIAVVQ